MLSRSQKTATRVGGLGLSEVKGLIELRDVIGVFELRILWRNRENIAGVFKLTEGRMEIKPVPDLNRIYRIWFCSFCRGVVQTVMPQVELRNNNRSLDKNITIPRTLFSKCL